MAWQLGRYHLAQARLRPEIYEMSMDFENLVATRGDLVLASHDVPEWGTGWGRVKSVTLDGSGNCLGVVVDESTLTFQDGLGYGARFRLSASGNSLLQPLLNPATGTGSSISTNTVTLAELIAFGNPMPAVGDLVMFGVFQQESAQLLVTKVTPGKNLSAILTMVDYAPAVYTADANPPGVVPPVAAPGAIAPTVISATSASVMDSAGNQIPQITIQLAPATSVQTKWGTPTAIQYELRVTAGSELNDTGAYNPATSYSISDLVTYSGLDWMSLINSNVGTTPGTNGAVWVVVGEDSEWSSPASVQVTSQVVIRSGINAGTVYDIQLRYLYPKGAFSTWTLVPGHIIAPPQAPSFTWSDYTGNVPLTSLQGFGNFTPSQNITITRVQVTCDIPPVGCTTDAELSIVVSPAFIFNQALTSGAAPYDSGPLSILVSSGTLLHLANVVACVPGSGTAPLGLHITIQYQAFPS